jgi:hypothetical protein
VNVAKPGPELTLLSLPPGLKPNEEKPPGIPAPWGPPFADGGGGPFFNPAKQRSIRMYDYTQENLPSSPNWSYIARLFLSVECE